MNEKAAALFAKVRRSFKGFEKERTEEGSNVTASWDLHLEVEPDPVVGGYVAFVREVPGAAGQGETPMEAKESVVESVTEILQLRLLEQMAEVNGEDDQSQRVALSL